MDTPLGALRGSVGHLYQLCRGLDDGQLDVQSYCSDWPIAGVLSHLGSGAVIMNRRLVDALSGQASPDDFAPSVWAEWDAKTSRAKADDALGADEGILEALEAVNDAERARLDFPMGPLTLDFDQFVGMRLNEHAFHTWDIEVVFDPRARLPHDDAALVVDNLQLIARYTARPTGEVRTVRLRTADPVRDFAVRLSADSAELEVDPGSGGQSPDLELPSEAFCRLVYGRLDPDHTPAFTGDRALLETLRAVFPGP
jgi:uncharacterized protein (TIGR03083 family)